MWRGSFSPHSGGTVPDLHRVPFQLADLRRESSIESMTATRAASLWVPVVAWAALIFGLSSIPHLGTGLGPWDTILRKCAHATEYAVLAALIFRALERPWAALALAVAYSATDEFHQTFVRGRHGSPYDVLIDAAGAAIGLAAYRRTVR